MATEDLRSAPGTTLAEVLRSAAYVAGRRAGQSSLSPAACPYTENSAEAIEWRRGLQSALDQINAYADAQTRRDLAGRWDARPDFDLNLRGRAA